MDTACKSTQPHMPQCRSGCTGYGTQPCCPPLIVLTSAYLDLVQQRVIDGRLGEHKNSFQITSTRR
jgi:hypothetical protein